MNSPSVYIIDDNAAILEGLKNLLQSVNLSVQAYQNPQTFLEQISETTTGCVLLDVRMPYLSGMMVLERIVSKHPQLSVIMLSGYGDIPMAVKAIMMGAVDFVAKPFKEQSLLDLVQTTLQKNTPSELENTANIIKLYGFLTAREREILNFIAEGKLNKHIATHLGIAVSTVEMHRSNIMEKMQSENIAQLIKKYLLVSAFIPEVNPT